MRSGSSAISFGVTLPQIKRGWEDARTTAIELEQLGYDSLWVNDHLYGVPLPTVPILESWTLLSAIGAVTSRVQLGTLVSPPGFRNPALHAKMAATLDQITGGRVVVGLGAGWFEMEFRGYGYPFPPVRVRLEQLREAALLMKQVWTKPGTTFTGRHFRTDEVICEPRPVRIPPILIGGGGERVLLHIAAECADIWNNLAVDQGALGRKVACLREHCRAIGRDPEEIVVSQQTVVVIGVDDADARAKLEKAGRVYGGHLGDIERNGIWGTPTQVIERIQRQVKEGCRMFVVEFFGKDTREPARLFAETVLPAFHGPQA
jgi:alkanesulfonate monooxygenase SsuD/methylene tetrahydromethanopterin reductase-like flavin-dependent oxidoreductase (luciferase family)